MGRFNTRAVGKICSIFLFLFAKKSPPISEIVRDRPSYSYYVSLIGSHYRYPIDQLSLNGLISRFLSSTCTEVSGVENIGQCGRLSQLSWLLGAL